MSNYNSEIRPARDVARSVERDAPQSREGGYVAKPSLTDRPAGDDGMPRSDQETWDALYSSPVESRRSGALYNAFSYPTKIDPEAIAVFVAAHTSPGDTVLDVFAGSGTTGIAVRLCERPTARMLGEVERLGLDVQWGPRHAELYEISVLGALLANTMCSPPPPEDFERAANEIVDAAQREFGWMYETRDDAGDPGRMRHIVWSEVLTCPTCGDESAYWDLALEWDPVALRNDAPCPHCGEGIVFADAARACRPAVGESNGDVGLRRVRRPMRVYGATGKRQWSRPVGTADLDLLARIAEVALPASVPDRQIRWGDLHRSGYHLGINWIEDLYTRRNFIAFGALWEAIEEQPAELRDALRLLVLSYNASHGTLMTRVVVKSGMAGLVLTGAQSGVLYISGLPVEKNVFQGVRRKTRTLCEAFALTACGSARVNVHCASSTRLDLADASIDYVFTDPPFGDFIPYSEINQINESWLGRVTEPDEEAIVSKAQGKDVAAYGALMKSVFAEVGRVLKPTGAATVVFHSSKPQVWSVLGDALTNADLEVQRTSVLDKRQPSFKQVVSEGGTRHDAVFLLTPASGDARKYETDHAEVLADVHARFGHEDDQRLYSRYVAGCLQQGIEVAMSAPEFYRLHVGGAYR